RIIEKKTDFYFAYNNKEIKDTQSVRLLKNTSLFEVLADISKSTGLKFKRINNSIYVSKIERLNAAEIPIAEILDPQQFLIKGKITSSEDNEPLPGVSIILKGTTNGTVANVDGSYSITADENAVLQYSYIGFTSQEILVGSQSVIDVALLPDAEQLEEVVVIGYGTQKKSD
ncbi:unnamed protein product, partial [Scytosiphon promiscuus]